MQLKDKDNTNVMPNTSADQVSYGSTNVAAALAALEQGGGGGSSASPLAGKKICFFGDSITDPISATGGYTQLVCKKLGSYYGIASGDLNPYQYGTQGGQRNAYGISGTNSSTVRGMVMSDEDNGRYVFTSEYYRNIYKRWLDAGFEEYKDFTQYDAVVIQIGTNVDTNTDTLDADIPDICVNDISSYPYSYSAPGKAISSATIETPMNFFDLCFPNTYYGNLAASIEYIRWKNPNCRIFLVTIPPNDRFNDTSDDHYMNVRNEILALADKLSVQVIDAQVRAGLGLWNIGYWSADGIHPNTIGKELWASYIANELNKQWYASNVTTT